MVPDLKNIDTKKAEAIVESALAQRTVQPSWLDAASVISLLDCYGIRTADTALAATPQ